MLMVDEALRCRIAEASCDVCELSSCRGALPWQASWVEEGSKHGTGTMPHLHGQERKEALLWHEVMKQTERPGCTKCAWVQGARVFLRPGGLQML